MSLVDKCKSIFKKIVTVLSIILSLALGIYFFDKKKSDDFTQTKDDLNREKDKKQDKYQASKDELSKTEVEINNTSSEIGERHDSRKESLKDLGVVQS